MSDSTFEESREPARVTESAMGQLVTSEVGSRGSAPSLGAGRRLLDSLPVSLVLLDEQLRVEFANAAFRKQFVELVRGDGIERFFPRLELDKERARVRRVGSAHVEASAITRVGACEVRLDLSTVLVDGCEYLCLACHRAAAGQQTASDVSQSVPPPAPLAAVNRQAVSSNLALVVAHELNNMLSVIMASTDLAGRLLERAQDPVRDLERVEQAAQRSAEALGDFLRFMGQRGEAEDLEPSQVLSSLSRLLERSVRRGIQLRLQLEPTRPVRVLRAELEASVLGLVDNAREALGGSGEISVVAAERRVAIDEARALGLAPGWYASIRVTDSGPGMDDETLSRAGDPYFTTKPRARKAGLGLTAVRAFSHAAGGGLVLTSVPERGTTAELLLPLISA